MTGLSSSPAPSGVLSCGMFGTLSSQSDSCSSMTASSASSSFTRSPMADMRAMSSPASWPARLSLATSAEPWLRSALRASASRMSAMRASSRRANSATSGSVLQRFSRPWRTASRFFCTNFRSSMVVSSKWGAPVRRTRGLPAAGPEPGGAGGQFVLLTKGMRQALCTRSRAGNKGGNGRARPWPPGRAQSHRGLRLPRAMGLQAGWDHSPDAAAAGLPAGLRACCGSRHKNHSNQMRGFWGNHSPRPPEASWLLPSS